MEGCRASYCCRPCHTGYHAAGANHSGSLILLGVLAGWLVSPWFYLIDVMVGAGLLTAGLTGFCGMARLLAKMPWNH